MAAPDAARSFDRKEILIDGVETSYLEAGSGDPVILLHGGEFGGEAEICWEHTIADLAKHYRVLAPDLLGFGRTAKLMDFVDGRGRRIRHLSRFLDTLCVSGAPCIGNSMGGMLLLFDAASECRLLSPAKIVTIAGGGALHDTGPVEALFDYDCTPEGMRAIVHALFHANHWFEDEAYIDRRRQASLVPGAWEAIAAARFRRPKAFQEARTPSGIAYERITTPTLIVAGEQDKIKPHGWWNELHEKIRGSKVLIVPDAGHCPQIERPDIVNPALLEFLAE